MDQTGGEIDYGHLYGTLANFEVEKKVGKGQFSEVYKARCKVDGSVVALKKVQVRQLTGYPSDFHDFHDDKFII